MAFSWLLMIKRWRRKFACVNIVVATVHVRKSRRCIKKYENNLVHCFSSHKFIFSVVFFLSLSTVYA
ncbi:hypothetical protein Pint_27717 [Pistacia integerrima]|uniref:Uncharacterized protein n=1 Tax=Pistacia integerrima TaxID=434235 RepID=A0ACC0YPB1_9ROSI|nr:hypothetical protein Pint_27717 [Pistacia integerrima]